MVQMNELLNIIKESDRRKSKIRIFCGIKIKQEEKTDPKQDINDSCKETLFDNVLTSKNSLKRKSNKSSLQPLFLYF